MGAYLELRYFDYKNSDAFMPLWAKKRVERNVKIFEDIVERACRGSYQSILNQDQFSESDQRNEFMMYVFQEIMKWASSKLDEVLERRSRK
jgi:hypothetical protein